MTEDKKKYKESNRRSSAEAYDKAKNDGGTATVRFTGEDAARLVRGGKVFGSKPKAIAAALKYAEGKIF